MATTADLMVDTLLRWGVRRVYGLPGDGCNGLMEALRQRKDEMAFVSVRHEEAAAFAASGHAKLTGRLGACLATSGPGAIHLLAGLYDARLDGAPVLAITGQTYSDLIGSRYQQEVDTLGLLANVAEYNVQVSGPAHARLATDMACRTAIGRRSVAHLSVPIDVQVARHGRPSEAAVPGSTAPGTVEWRTRPPQAHVERAAELMAGMERPLVLLGQGARGAVAEVDALVRRLQAPFCKALLGKDVVPDRHPHCLGGIGHLGTAPATKAVASCDGLVMLGTSFPYAAYLPKPGQAKVLQVDTHPERLGARAPVDLGLVGDVGETLRALVPLVPRRRPKAWLRDLQAQNQEWWRLLDRRASDDVQPMRPQSVAAAVAGALRPGAVVCCDTGNVTVWGARHVPMGDGDRFLASGTLASMGCALPYAIAAQEEFPGRCVVALVGDGGLLMLPGELATAVQHGLPVKVVVFNNGSLGMIRWEQLVFLGNPTYGTTLPKVDFAGLARAMGAQAWTVEAAADLPRALRRLMQARGPALLDCKVDPDEPPWPPTLELSSALRFAKALAKGEPTGPRLALTLFRDQVDDHLARKRNRAPWWLPKRAPLRRPARKRGADRPKATRPVQRRA